MNKNGWKRILQEGTHNKEPTPRRVCHSCNKYTLTRSQLLRWWTVEYSTRLASRGRGCTNSTVYRRVCSSQSDDQLRIEFLEKYFLRIFGQNKCILPHLSMLSLYDLDTSKYLLQLCYVYYVSQYYTNIAYSLYIT